MTVTVPRPLVPAVPRARRTAAPAAPACSRCGSPRTEPVVTMRLCTSDADSWFRCEECEHVFSTAHRGD
jgi:hypothetical protein